MEDDLLPLSWLQEISIPLSNPLSTEESSVTSNKSNVTNIVKGKKSISYLLKNFQQLSSEFRVDPNIRPTYSYATLILLALNSTAGSKMSLKAIYSWIKDTFPFYKMSESTAWQNSIRHNLSLNKCFVKVPRCKNDQPGKGGFWKLDPDCEKKLRNGENFYKLRKQRRKIAKISVGNVNLVSLGSLTSLSSSNSNTPPNAEKEEVLNTKGELVQIIDFEKDSIVTEEDNIEQMSLFFQTNTVSSDDVNEQQQQMELMSIDWDSQHNIFELDIDQLISIGEL